MLPWQELNTVAHLNAEFGVHCGKSLCLTENMLTADNQSVHLNIQHAIIIKEVQNNKEIQDVVKQAYDYHLELSEFTREMIETTDDRKVIEITRGKDKNKIEYLGVLIF